MTYRTWHSEAPKALSEPSTSLPPPKKQPKVHLLFECFLISGPFDGQTAIGRADEHRQPPATLVPDGDRGGVYRNDPGTKDYIWWTPRPGQGMPTGIPLKIKGATYGNQMD